MKAALTPGQASDYTGYPDTVDDELPPARVLIADKGYDSAPIRETVKAEGGTPPPNPPSVPCLRGLGGGAGR